MFKLTVYPITAPAVCVFLGTWDSGSSTPGPPYIAKWPDQYGNVKQRSVPRPEIVSRYFSVSNKIDTHNQLRQHELALEEHWLTQDPWFRLDTTFIGMTVTDAFQLARHAASDTSGIRRMGIKEFALRCCYDMFNRKTADEPLSEVVSSNPPSSMQQHHHSETSNTPISKDEAMLAHQIKKTKQRDGSNNPTRRHCSMKEEGCEGKAISYECQHPACLQFKKAGNNRFGDTFGVFICDNMACRMKHWNNVVEQSRVERS
jgi:hypothetical protein